MAKVLDLHWEGPYCPLSFLEKQNPAPGKGVYLWVCEHKAEVWIDYVGKALGSPSLGKRQQEHVCGQLGLKYKIPGEFRTSGKEWTPGIYPAYKEDLVDSERHLKLLEESKNYLRASKVYLAPIKDLSDKEINRLERTLIWQLQPLGNTQGKKSQPKEPIEVTHHNADWFQDGLKNSFEKTPIIKDGKP